jgi:hypothetical protein
MTDPREQDDARLLDAVRRGLDATPVPDAVALRLAAARREAVATFGAHREIKSARSAWLPLSALAASVLAVVAAVALTDGRALPLVDDARVLAAAQDMDLLDDLEFLAWLDDDHAG